MKVLVATERSQGARERDLWSCIEGELVRPIEERCGAPGPIGSCSCETAFLGLVSGGLTSTAEVRELSALDVEQYEAALRDSLTRREATFVLVDRYADELVRAANGLREGAVVERWDDWMGLRFDVETGELVEDVTGMADVDPGVLDDL